MEPRKINKMGKKIINFLRQKYPELKDKEIPSLLNDIKRFVLVIQKIYTEPQYQRKIIEKTVEGKIVKVNTINIPLEEFAKVMGKDEPRLSLTVAKERLNKYISKNKDGA